jgi:hypothetical protein
VRQEDIPDFLTQVNVTTKDLLEAKNYRIITQVATGTILASSGIQIRTASANFGQSFKINSITADIVCDNSIVGCTFTLTLEGYVIDTTPGASTTVSLTPTFMNESLLIAPASFVASMLFNDFGLARTYTITLTIKGFYL